MSGKTSWLDAAVVGGCSTAQHRSFHKLVTPLMRAPSPMTGPPASADNSTGQVVAYVRGLIERRELRPGDRLPAERDLATRIGVSRPTVRAGLRALAAMGVVQSKHGSGTYIPDGPPSLGSESLRFQAALHGFTRAEMYEARR